MNIYIGKDNRTRVAIKDQTGKYHIKSYPRILMEEKLGRPLEPYEDVHHIDGNPLNNDINNLQIILHGEHQKQHSQKYFDKMMTCPICGKEFLWTALQQRYFYSQSKRRDGSKRIKEPFCSKRCVGIYGRQEQIRRNSYAECGLNGEGSPNANPVPIT